MKTENHRIDVHYHIIPRPYVQALGKLGIGGSTFVPFPDWTPEKAVTQLDRTDVATAVTSLSTPGVWFGDIGMARRLSRLCNEFQASMMADYPGRFGSFAFLPLPDVEGALRELEYAMDKLGHDGVVLLSDIEGRYLGHPDYEEVFAELNRRRAVVFIHPNDDPRRSRRYEVFSPLLEWPIHTTRAAMDLLYSGRLGRYPDIRFVLAHGGGALPYLAYRIAAGRQAGEPVEAGDQGMKTMDQEIFQGGLRLLQRFFFDTASPGCAHLAALQAFVDVGQIVFGTDGGWTPPVQTALAIKELLAYDGFDEAHLDSIGRQAALTLFPRLAEANDPHLSTVG